MDENTRPWYTIDELNAWADKYQNEQWHKAAIRLGEEWVGLTKDEKETLSYKAEGNTWMAVELAEAKLKEKNHD